MKPVRRTNLLETMERVLEKQRRARKGKRDTALLPPAPDGSVQLPGEKTQLPGTRVLVAEDNTINQKVAERMLQSHGCEVTVVGDGQKAVDELGRTPFDLVMMDCRMPVMDGYEATRTIRESDGDMAGVYIVAMTANALQSNRERCLAVGMDDYIAKPVTPHGMQNVLERWIERSERTSGDRPSRSGRLSDPRDPVDPEIIDDLKALATDENPGFMEELVGVFLESSSDQRTAIHQAFERKEAEGVADSAHSLASNAGNFGAYPLCDLCKKLERLACEGKLAAAGSLLKGFDVEFERVTDALRTYVDS